MKETASESAPAAEATLARRVDTHLEARVLYELGLQYEEVGRILGMGRHTAQRACHTAGGSTRPRSEHHKPRSRAERQQLERALYERAYTSAAIARAFDLAATTVRIDLLSLGVELRPKSRGRLGLDERRRRVAELSGPDRGVFLIARELGVAPSTIHRDVQALGLDRQPVGKRRVWGERSSASVATRNARAAAKHSRYPHGTPQRGVVATARGVARLAMIGESAPQRSGDLSSRMRSLRLRAERGRSTSAAGMALRARPRASKPAAPRAGVKRR